MILNIGDKVIGEVDSEVVITSKEDTTTIVKPNDWKTYTVYPHRAKKVEIDGEVIYENQQQ